MAEEGFIVHAYARSVRGQTRLFFVGRLGQGGVSSERASGGTSDRGSGTFAVVQEAVRPELFVRLSEAAGLRGLSEASGASLETAEYRTLDGEQVLRVSCPTVEARQGLREALHGRGLRTYEADLRVTDQYRIQRRIHGPVRLEGASRPGRHVGRVFLNPSMEAADFLPALSVLSMDIETDGRHETVRAVALCHRAPVRVAGDGGEPTGGWREVQRVLFLGPDPGRLGTAAGVEPQVECFGEEGALLARLGEHVRALDPDIITGWNVVDFDLNVLARAFRRCGLPFRIGRSREQAVYLGQSEGRGSRIIVPGRQVWDAVRLVRAGPRSFEDYSLETVASTILGHGKSLQTGEGESRLAAIERLYVEDPAAFCAYCLQDARLVLEILEATGLLELTLWRCRLIGVAPELAWTSIAAFEHLYIEAMHERGLVAPSLGVDALPLDGAPGGGILTPQPGLFDDVLVFDFQSLYPSIIRTFNIDPAAYVSAETLAGLAPEAHAELLCAPNGACFRREPGILPQLLDRFFERREEAQAAADPVASFVYKIIMNSFYGVLGARGCRFAGSALAGAVTSFGQRILSWCKGLLERHGYRVLYGDTDSLFVAGQPAQAQELSALVNDALAEYLRAEYRVQPRLKLRYEKHYLRFFLPPLRGAGGAGPRGTDAPPQPAEAGAEGPGRPGAASGRAGEPTSGRAAGPTSGRAKGYAGLLPGAGEPGGGGQDPSSGSLADRIEIRGMEAVRRDWTDLAHEFQVRLLELAFTRRPVAEIRAYVLEVIRRLREGELDARLVYRKALRKSVAEYTSSTPPHVKAAGLLEPGRRRGLIRYVVTLEGPQPVGRLTAPPDYQHYVERQLKPIASAFTDALGVGLGALFGDDQQLELF